MGTTTIYVTHDQVEAMGMGDRIAVMSKGTLRQVGTPQDVYDDPADTFVATFLGSPPMNIVEREDVTPSAAVFPPQANDLDCGAAPLRGHRASARFRSS